MIRPTSLEEMLNLVKGIEHDYPDLALFFGRESLLYFITRCIHWSVSITDFFRFLNKVISYTDNSGSYYYGDELLSEVVKMYADGALVHDMVKTLEKAKVS
ncbi:hypothetical protein [Vogesella indigofera]|uniref:Uncharacterized protein n=1 Tax=Vogesella indigofera TaxID=45465 RepID=A0ABT5I8P1_VOGIN|nr:hypothetical protein [Vogesella indigofera]MDC7692474.1 hypothetical protein [Vogesella indigofera]